MIETLRANGHRSRAPPWSRSSPSSPATLDILPKPTDAFGTAQATAFAWDAVPDYGAFKRRLEPLIMAVDSADASAPINRRSISELGH